jgi:hypothetical protein
MLVCCEVDVIMGVREILVSGGETAKVLECEHVDGLKYVQCLRCMCSLVAW